MTTYYTGKLYLFIMLIYCLKISFENILEKCRPVVREYEINYNFFWDVQSHPGLRYCIRLEFGGIISFTSPINTFYEL